ncbi:hypothetical protein MBRA1_003890 [Malassezia brasiliensis]|uniref:Uncharacterized protein n=1 Tax=Malassezia brasiliensis TaxID=1821822 RepID=A0AAF0E0D1_9BASI|nr:hypothetical protein MBRA1_003890 [Malassezia brasiliensis]
MLHIQQGQWPAGPPAPAPPVAASSPLANGPRTQGTHPPLSQEPPAPVQVCSAQPQGIDAAYLSQRLTAFLIDTQHGDDQVQSVWDAWHSGAKHDGPSLGLLDKPQTAAPPVTPPNGVVAYNGFKSEHTPSLCASEPTDTMSSLSFDRLSLGADDGRL